MHSRQLGILREQLDMCTGTCLHLQHQRSAEASAALCKKLQISIMIKPDQGLASRFPSVPLSTVVQQQLRVAPCRVYAFSLI